MKEDEKEKLLIAITTVKIFFRSSRDTRKVFFFFFFFSIVFVFAPIRGDFPLSASINQQTKTCVPMLFPPLKRFFFCARVDCELRKKDYKVEQESFGRSFRENIFRILLYFWRGFPIRCCFSCHEISTPVATASGKKARSDFDDFSPEYKQHSRKAFSMKISSVTRRNQNSF